MWKARQLEMFDMDCDQWNYSIYFLKKKKKKTNPNLVSFFEKYKCRAEACYISKETKCFLSLLPENMLPIPYLGKRGPRVTLEVMKLCPILLHVSISVCFYHFLWTLRNINCSTIKKTHLDVVIRLHYAGPRSH